MQNCIRRIKDFSLKKKSILFDSDVLIDTIKIDILEEFEDVFKEATKCIVNSTKIEVLNTKNPSEFAKLSKLIAGFWAIPLTSEIFKISEILQKYNSRLNKCPALGDYLIASELISLGSEDVYILTGNVQDFAGEIFTCADVFDVYRDGKRKIWTLLKRNKKYNRATNSFDELETKED
jgi:hypothetical protein